MSSCVDDKLIDELKNIPVTEHFSELFNEFEGCNKDEQKQKILEMSEQVKEMNEKEFNSIFTMELFKKIDFMIYKKKLSMENACSFLKPVGYCKVLKNFWNPFFEKSSLSRRFEKMIIEEEKKNEGKNEKILADLCECYIFLSCSFTSKLLSISVPCMLKVVLKKEERKKAQKEVEMALLALSNVRASEIEQELYLNEIKEIIEYHQEHRNLTSLAYQSAWEFLICRLSNERSLEEVVVNELHFAREAIKELEELMKCMNWKKKVEKEKEKRREEKEVIVLIRWIHTLYPFFVLCKMRNEGNYHLISSIVRVHRASTDNNGDLSFNCFLCFRVAAESRAVKIDDLLKSGVVEVFLEKMQQTTLQEKFVSTYLDFFLRLSRNLKGNTDGEIDEAKRKATKMEIFEKIEEEGYEDSITRLHGLLSFLCGKYFLHGLSSNISDYFVSI
ncbi:uncharacterized protein MONOS_18621 [Monocercomonoides exilis]|uniref:uncharacterized protein n=1 Tax=Monocercomonoides exilis TaxID=2049356 RepID=UPI00355945E8|nr:hypothetical protein MONOS_18621 [Monocercomonoides exilis]